MKSLEPALAFVVLVFAGCAPVVHPAALVDAEELLESRQFHAAAPLAPQAASHARRVQQDALQALDQGDSVGAELLAELSAASVYRTVVLARLAHAERRAAEAELSLSTEGNALRALEAARADLAQETQTLEVRAKVLRDALPVATSERASPQRQAARREAARALATQARLLCLASELVQPDADSAASLLQDRLVQLEARLDIAVVSGDAGNAKRTGNAGSAAPSAAAEVIDEALALRAACLKRLTLVRREQSRAHPESSPADALLTELSESAFSPLRDDRGVVVTLPLAASSSTKDELEKSLGPIAAAAKHHPDFPLLLVGHASTATDEKGLVATASRARETLLRLGVAKVSLASAGNRIPLVQPSDANSDKNARLEVVFVASGL